MALNINYASNIKFSRLYTLGSKMSNKQRGYRRATLGNTHTGETAEIILINPHKLAGEHEEQQHRKSNKVISDYLFVNPNNEAHIDINKAFEDFSTLEKRILFRVLVQGQGIGEATKYMKGSLRNWQYWFSRQALPKLREKLRDYFQDGRITL